MTTKPILPEPEVWMRKGTRRAFKHAVRQEYAGAPDDELERLAAVAMSKLAGDMIRVMLERSVVPAITWVAYCETLARKFKA